MEKKTETLEHFKTAIGSTVKSLSNSEDIEISFGNQNTKIKKNTIRLPDIEKIDNKINFKQINLGFSGNIDVAMCSGITCLL